MTTREQFTRAEIQRLLDLSEAQLAYWERLGLVESRRSAGRRVYDFRDLISLRTARQLVREGVPAHKLRRALAALAEKLSYVKAPLTELRILSNGRDLIVEHEGARLEPLTGQLVLNFDTRELGEKLRAFPEPRGSAQVIPIREEKARLDAPAETGHWMARASKAESTGTRAEAIASYERVLEREPRRVDAWINLGTLHYEGSEFQRAFECFRRASEIDANNALSLYNVGCVLEDLGQVHSAREYLRAAVRLDPAFADAHYNLALVCERLGAQGEAAGHWRRYVELDPASPWCEYARQRIGPHLV
jgi:tetratricopeptide (TPR) repeat protein